MQADLASETGTDRKVIIENQMGDTDHDHLGKLITYASGKGAGLVIWVVKHAREEHKAAIEWLNNHTDEGVGFFLCEIKVIQIGGSDPAMKFEVIERPNDWAKGARKSEGFTETQARRREYWEAFQDHAFGNEKFEKAFNRRKEGTGHWMDYGINSSACHIVVSQIQKRNELDVELYINEDKGLFRSLLAQKETIEAASGLKFDWRELPERKASRIVVEKAADLGNRDEWAGQFDWLVDTMLNIKKTFKKYV